MSTFSLTTEPNKMPLTHFILLSISTQNEEIMNNDTTTVKAKGKSRIKCHIGD